jgi:zinc/manganese transport system substrate-binding protein
MKATRFFPLALAFCCFAAVPARADLNVFACEPEWGSLVRELGGDHVSIYVATTAMQDPHHIDARPSLIAKARAADLTVCTGAELEVGWLPAVQRQSANPKILPGGPGAFEATAYVRMLDIPSRLDRADGDVHAAGNPHVHTDPRNILKIVQPLTDTLIRLDPMNESTYRARSRAFADRWTAAIDRWQATAAPLRGVAVAIQHKNWVYLFDWLGMKEGVALEPKPGVPPSAGYLAQVVDQVRRSPVAMVIRASHEDGRPSDFLTAQAHVPSVVLPFTVGGTPGAKDLFGLFDDTIARLLDANARKS